MITTLLVAAAAFPMTAAAVDTPPPPVPPDELACLEEAFVIHLTNLSNIAQDEIVYVACDANWAEDFTRIEALCFAQLTMGPEGSEIVTTLITRDGTELSLIPAGSFVPDPDSGWLDPSATMTVEAPPLPPRT
jgi:hypothetical protein